MFAVNNEEWSRGSRFTCVIVVRELVPRKKLHPVVMLSRNEMTKIIYKEFIKYLPCLLWTHCPVASFQDIASSGGSGRISLPSVSLGPAGEQLAPLLQNSMSLATWNCHGVRRPAVWMIGHSYIYWAAQRAAYHPGGLDLGFKQADVYWRGIRGLKWLQVLPEVVAVSRMSQSPTVLVIHAGGNDLCSTRVAELISIMRSDFERFAAFFPDLVVVWSEIVPRVLWKGARNKASLERTRRLLNVRVSRHVRGKWDVVIRHRQLEGDNRGLMLQDGVHLNDIGLDIFLSGLQDAIDRALFLLQGVGRSEV
ncbi:uncharacterized protein LOC142759946 [Rhinoderma darwinii]|uniref:uncharacterized protein LOC142759946 n=1 Tax=Rhinoderma darwinii TaxID=43563 RepID=UPI003F6774BA